MEICFRMKDIERFGNLVKSIAVQKQSRLT